MVNSVQTNAPVPDLSDERRALSVKEFCLLYGIGRTLTYQELGSGRLRARKLGKRTLITRDDAETWLRLLPSIEESRHER